MDEKTKDRFTWDPFLLACRAMDKSEIQDSFCYRALSEARLLAEQLVPEKGPFRPKALARNIPNYEAGYSDDVIQMYHQRFLQKWESDSTFMFKFRRFSLPLCHAYAEDVIRWTLDLAPKTPLQDYHIKRAVIAACLTPLRQSIGSCFATAPAIEVQQFYLDLFVEDLYQLLSRGSIRRVVDGVEYTAPFCLSTGVGDLKKIINPERPYHGCLGLIRAFEIGGKIPENISFSEKINLSEKICRHYYRPGMCIKDLILSSMGEETCAYFKSVVDNALLKIWEFTLASYCDIKMEFSKWNLGWCVGLPPQEAGGIGEVLYKALEERLQHMHAEVEKAYQEVMIAHEQLRAVETLADHATTMEELRRIKAEGIGKAHHLNVCEDLYEQAQEKEKMISEILPFLIRHYTDFFQKNFQEIYDPEFVDETRGYYEDRQAGFRLVYKHGRSETSLWTSIHNREQFIAVLDEFFRSVETPLCHFCEGVYQKQLVSEMTTVILNHLQTPAFFDSTFRRAQQRGRMPWAYSAGGNVEQIASLYYRQTSSLKSESRPIQDELDLFTFIIEAMKGLSPTTTNEFIKDRDRGLLFQSPTHVCLLLPGVPLFQKAWSDRGFTYTWIRDQWIDPARQFYLEQQISKEEQRELYRRLGVEKELKPSMTIDDFSRSLKQIPTAILGSFLFQTLPLIPKEKCQALLHTKSEALPPFLSSAELFQWMFKFSEGSSREAVRASMRELKLASSCFLFADTNWPNGYFSFVIHPITLELEVWKTDRAGVCGAGLPLVKSWFGKEAWSIFLK